MILKGKNRNWQGDEQEKKSEGQVVEERQEGWRTRGEIWCPSLGAEVLHSPQQHLWGTDSPCSRPGSKRQFHALHLPAPGADWSGEVRKGLEARGLWQRPEPGQLRSVSGSWLSRFLPGELKWKAAAGYSQGWEVRRKQAAWRGAAWSWK